MGRAGSVGEYASEMGNDSDRSEAKGAAMLPATDRRLLELVRQGDPDAGHQLVREYYLGVYRYLLYLTSRADIAEDLTQETFVQAWSHLDSFEGRSPLRPWLHRIAHREFLQHLRRRREESSLEETRELADTHAHEWKESVELNALLLELPLEEREMVVLHYVEGYHGEEIARILNVPIGRVKFRLVEARARLRKALGEGDLVYLNQAPGDVLRRWSWMPLEEMSALEARLTMGGSRRSVSGVQRSDVAAQNSEDQRPKTGSGAKEENMERREFLRRSAAGAAGLALADNEVVDSRLTRKVAAAFKATALSDLCERLRAETGVPLFAAASVADEKVTLFCQEIPLRDVMRQLSRPFGYTWMRSGKDGEYRYELAQDLRSQLMEEELANRDRNAALVALERELETYRLYLELAPDEAVARAKTAPPEERRLLERMGGSAWGAIQIYFRLTGQEMSALRGGQELKFSQAPKPGELALPEEIARGVLQSLRDVYFHRYPDGFGISTGVAEPDPGALRPTAVPEARATLTLALKQTEPGRVALTYSAGAFSQSDLPRNSGGATWEGDGSVAAGTSPAILKPDNRAANARLARGPALCRLVTVEVTPSCRPAPDRLDGGEGGATTDSQPQKGLRATSADALEAIHRATGMPVVGDFYTRLHPPDALSFRGLSLFDTLNQLADQMNLRWNKDGDWVQFRSATYFHDRQKEVPNRLLTRWSASRQKHGQLTLEDLVEIAGLSDAQLDAVAMAEGAQQCWGLREWSLAQRPPLRRDLRFLAELTPAQRQEAASPAGLPFTKLSLAQQQRFIAIGMRFDQQPLEALDELQGGAVRAEYPSTGCFVWVPPGDHWYRWAVPVVPGREGRRAVMPAVSGRSPEEARAAARRLEPRLLEAILPEMRRLRPEIQTTEQVVDAGEIVPARPDLMIVFIPGLSNRRTIHISSLTADFHCSTW